MAGKKRASPKFRGPSSPGGEMGKIYQETGGGVLMRQAVTKWAQLLVEIRPACCNNGT